MASLSSPGQAEFASLPTRGEQEQSAYSHRFGDWNSMRYLCKFGKDGTSRAQTFYSGDDVSTRMGAVRKAIIYVREHWNQYPALMEDLRSYLKELTDRSHETLEQLEHLRAVLSSNKVWKDGGGFSEDDDLNVIRLYTSKVGYDQIFRIINQAFRADDLTEQEKRLRCAVFLIELLNIDLFNYTLREPSRLSNFQGTVYRGVLFSEDQLMDFVNLAERPVSERFWAIPLAMMSASTDREVALREFARVEETERANVDGLPTRLYPFLWRIHVVGLHPKYLQIYHERFPSSVVSTICAVPIRELSDFDVEDEVLLRGPFFQLVCVREELLEGRDKPIHVMDLVMLNANRDHPSTMQLGEVRGEKARQLFACLVGMWRAEVCMNLARSYGLTDDTEEYKQIHLTERAKFESYC